MRHQSILSAVFAMAFYLATTACLTNTTCLVGTVQGATISEFEPNPAGLDPELQSIELSGTANAEFSGVLLGIGGESGRIGRVDYLAAISGRFDANGLLVSEIGDLFSPTLTVVLADSFSGTVGMTDIDGNNDGIADNLMNFGTIFDAIGVPDNVAGQQFLYGSQLGGQNFRFTGDEPELIFRERSDGEWYAINDLTDNKVYDVDGRDISAEVQFSSSPFQSTFGQINPSITAIPEPSVAFSTCLVLSSMLLVRRRRK